MSRKLAAIRGARRERKGMGRLLVFAALAVTVCFGTLGVSPVSAGNTFTIVDTLGVATPSTTFDRLDSGGMTISAFQQVGPEFTLTQQTIITEIGGFIADGGVFGTAPLVVQIRPEVNGNPDPTTVLATFLLTTDNDPLVISYESTRPNLTLGPGSYFALFAEPEGSAADHYLLADAFSPFAYRAGSPVLGALCSGTPCQTPPGFPAAVRILGQLAEDVTPPVLTIPSDIAVDATSPAGAAVNFVATATDDTDPNPTVACDPASGSMFPIGTTTVTCTASDSSGNEASGSFTVHVRGASEQLAALRAAVSGIGPAGSLSAKVDVARADLGRDDVRATCSTLAAFVREVQAQRGKTVGPSVADDLAARANRIRAVLGC